ncbi:uncharacterized protein LOC124266273 [Haliotis rubra]|uniref:uncharacterized protein LOC124266273 n=1 Tax=Haliotis rubra TaxID=36100 RepID=UPI001EE5622C|nr:uncharacterized protein LOC124266273 [Haliotis rubra]
MVLTWILLICVSFKVGSNGAVDDICHHIQSCCLDEDKLCQTDISSDICKVNCGKYHDCSSNHVRLSRVGTECQNYCTTDLEKCNVECMTGYYGSKCHFGCSDRCVQRKCHKDNGTCNFGCKRGSFGQTCGSTCNPNCKDRTCHRGNGSCLRGCSAGYYGADCLNKCPTSCRYRVCDVENGDCLFGCTEGFYGSDCPHSCPDDCSLCHPETGKCIFEHIPVIEGMSCTTKMLVVFWGSAGAFLLLAGAAVCMYRSQACSFSLKKKKKGLDTLFIDDRAPMDIPNKSSQDTRSSHYEEILCSDADSHFQHISKSTGSINLRTLISTMKYPNQCSNSKRKRTRADAGRNATSLVSSVHTLNNIPSFWVGSETDVNEMSEHPNKEEEPLEKSHQASQREVVRFSDALGGDEAEGLDTSLKGTEGESKSECDDVSSEDHGKRVYISAIFNKKDDATMVHVPCDGIYPGLKKTD